MFFLNKEKEGGDINESLIVKWTFWWEKTSHRFVSGLHKNSEIFQQKLTFRLSHKCLQLEGQWPQKADSNSPT